MDSTPDRADRYYSRDGSLGDYLCPPLTIKTCKLIKLAVLTAKIDTYSTKAESLETTNATEV